MTRSRHYASAVSRSSAVRQYRDGVEVSLIAGEFGVSERTVYRWVALAGVPRQRNAWANNFERKRVA